MLTILLIILLLALVGVLPTWPYSHAWGYYPSGGWGIKQACSSARLGDTFCAFAEMLTAAGTAALTRG